MRSTRCRSSPIWCAFQRSTPWRYAENSVPVMIVPPTMATVSPGWSGARANIPPPWMEDGRISTRGSYQLVGRYRGHLLSGITRLLTLHDISLHQHDKPLHVQHVRGLSL